jgi:hypothetical protein
MTISQRNALSASSRADPNALGTAAAKKNPEPEGGDVKSVA